MLLVFCLSGCNSCSHPFFYFVQHVTVESGLRCALQSSLSTYVNSWYALPCTDCLTPVWRDSPMEGQHPFPSFGGEPCFLCSPPLIPQPQSPAPNPTHPSQSPRAHLSPNPDVSYSPSHHPVHSPWSFISCFLQSECILGPPPTLWSHFPVDLKDQGTEFPCL